MLHSDDTFSKFPNKEKGFMAFSREVPPNEPVEERIRHFHEFSGEFGSERMRQQAFRCMNCGIPFCHYGCPLGNSIPDFNAGMKDDDWRRASEVLHSTNNFPEFTGRVCPAPCEAACVLGITDPAVTIELNEKAIADRAWREGWIVPQPPRDVTGKRVAVVGSGPAGLAAAQQLARAGHAVTVFERDDEPGGLLVYGIPDFKLDKELVRRRVAQMEKEGVTFRCNTSVGSDVAAAELREEYDALLLTVGATAARDLDLPGRDLEGIHFAMGFLPQQNRRVAGKTVEGDPISATGKSVVILGGGDTGSDCLGTSLRQGAKRVWCLELLPKPPGRRTDNNPWPYWPFILRTSTSHQEGGEREWSVLTKAFRGEQGKVKQLEGVRLEWSEPDKSGRRKMEEVPGSEFSIDCDLVLLALGFLHPEHDTAVKALGLEIDGRGNIRTDDRYQTSLDGVFAAGDARRGQSLVVWAIQEGREAARCIDMALMGVSDLPSADSYGYDGVGSAARLRTAG